MRQRLIGLMIAALVFALLVSAAAAARQAPSKRVVKLVQTAGGETVLANMRGRTLYSLSAERRGRFVCKGGCLAVWPPLLIAKGVTPKGPVRLGKVRRPDGRMQVTYRGRPLYRFAEDRRRGESNGDGIKDVGTWHVAKRPARSAPQPVQPEPYPVPYPSPYPASPPPPPTESEPDPPSEPTYPYPPYEY